MPTQWVIDPRNSLILQAVYGDVPEIRHTIDEYNYSTRVIETYEFRPVDHSVILDIGLVLDLLVLTFFLKVRMTFS